MKTLLSLTAAPILLLCAGSAGAHGIVYTDEALFLGDAPNNLVLEALDEAPDAVTALGVNSIDTTSDIGTFSPGDILPGIRITCPMSGGMNAVGPTQTDTGLGPLGAVFVRCSNDADLIEITFPGIEVVAVAFQVLTEDLTAMDAEVIAFSELGIPIQQVDLPDDGFVGIVADETDLSFSRVTINSPVGSNGNFEGVGMIYVAEAGTDVLIETDVEPAGANCADGGTRIRTGVDRNTNGVLDFLEVGAVEYVCDEAEAVDPDTPEPGCTFLFGHAQPVLSLLLLGAVGIVWRRRRL